MATRKTPGTTTPRATTRRPATKRAAAPKVEAKIAETADKPAPAKSAAPKSTAAPKSAATKSSAAKPATSKTAAAKPASAAATTAKAPAKPRAAKPVAPRKPAAPRPAVKPPAPKAPTAAPSIAERIEAAPTAVKAAGIAGLVAALGGAVLGALRIFRRPPAEGTVPTDLMGAEHPDGSERAIDDFRPDPTAPVPASEREALAPALAKPTLTGGQADNLPGSRH